MGLRERHRRAIPVLFTAIAAALTFGWLYHGFISPGEFYSGLDIRSQFVPWRCFYSLALDRGELGFWNPFFARGYPHLGEGQGGLLHPLHILAYAWLRVDAAAGLEMSLYIPFGLVGMLVFLRGSRRFTWTAAGFGAVLFGFSSFFIVHYVHVNLVWVYAHLPWALWLLHRCFYRLAPALSAVGLGLCFVSMILLGHPQMVYMNALAGAFYGGYLLICNDHGNLLRRRLLFSGLGLLAAILIGLLQILPTLDYVGRSDRGEMEAWQFTNCSLPPLALTVNLSPYQFSSRFVGDRLQLGNDEPLQYVEHMELPNYLGLGCVLLLIWGVLLWHRELLSQRHRRQTLYVAAVGVLIVVMMLGKYSGFTNVQRLVPVIRNFRCPVRYAALLYVWAVLLSSAVLNRLVRDGVDWDTRRLGLLITPLLLIIGVPLGIRLSGIGLADIPLTAGSWLGFAYGPILALSLTGLMLFYLRDEYHWCLALFCVISLADVVFYNQALLPSQQRFRFADMRRVQERMRTEDHRFRHYMADNDPVLNGHYMPNGYLGIAPQNKLEFFEPPWMRYHVPLASIRYTHVRRNGKELIHEVPNALPRLRLVPHLRPTADPLHADFQEHPPTTVALTEPGTGPAVSGPPLTSKESAEFLEDGYERVRIQVKVEHRRVLVLSDRWWPWWTATVDGKPRKIIPLYSKTMRGVALEPGDRELVLRYESRPFQFGLAPAAGGALILLVLLGFGLRQLRRAPLRKSRVAHRDRINPTLEADSAR